MFIKLRKYKEQKDTHKKKMAAKNRNKALTEKFLRDIKKHNDDVPNKDFLGPF